MLEMFLLMFSILWELLVLCSRLHLRRIFFPLKKNGKTQSFILEATLYCVAAISENAVPFSSFLFLSHKKQTAALAAEMRNAQLQ